MGRLLIVGGSTGLTGAVTLAAAAALRCGVGLVTLGIPRSLNPIFEVKTTEAMTLPLADDDRGFLQPDSLRDLEPALDSMDAIVTGPGLGRTKETGRFFHDWLGRLRGRAHLIDADGLWHLASETENLLAGDTGRVLSPHAGEMKRLLQAVGEADGDRKSIAQRFTARIPGVLVLKGPGTLVASGGEMVENPTGNPGLATGGSGDVLAGMIGAFLARGESPLAAARRAVWLHGRAADLAAYGDGTRPGLGEESLIASDVIAFLPLAIQGLQEEGR